MEEKYGLFQPQDNTPYFQVLFKRKKEEVLLEASEAGVEIEIKTDPLKEMGYGLLLGKITTMMCVV